MGQLNFGICETQVLVSRPPFIAQYTSNMQSNKHMMHAYLQHTSWPSSLHLCFTIAKVRLCWLPIVGVDIQKDQHRTSIKIVYIIHNLKTESQDSSENLEKQLDLNYVIQHVRISRWGLFSMEWIQYTISAHFSVSAPLLQVLPLHHSSYRRLILLQTLQNVQSFHWPSFQYALCHHP